MNNYDIDIDLDEIQKIKNPAIKSLVSQLRANGVAYTTSDSIGRKISRRFPEYRDKHDPILVISNDRKTNRSAIGFNFERVNFNDMDKIIKQIMKGFGNKL